MRKEVTITQGQNIIDILYDDFASCLFVKRPLAINWPDCSGSVGEYYAISNYSVEERNQLTDQLNDCLTNGTDEEQLNATADFLKLFANGNYAISKYIGQLQNIDFHTSNQIVHSETVPENERFSGWFYPHYYDHSHPLIYSITNNHLDQNRVDFYCEMIEKGYQPTVLSFEVCNMASSGYSTRYVLDGHHKLQAYIKLQKDIPFVHILKLEESLNKTVSLLKHAKSILQDFEYQHLFLNNDDNLLTIDFPNEDALTKDLDAQLSQSEKIDVSLIKLLQKYTSSTKQKDKKWLQDRIEMLRNNSHTTLLGLGKGLVVYEQRKDEKYGFIWYQEVVKTKIQLASWIRKTF